MEGFQDDAGRRKKKNIFLRSVCVAVFQIAEKVDTEKKSYAEAKVEYSSVMKPVFDISCIREDVRE